MKAILLVALALGLAAAAPARAGDAQLQALAQGSHRTPANVARDKFRHPVQVLQFFGLTDTMTAVEILPGGAAYWTEIMAPYLRDRGVYYAALAEDTTDYEPARRGNAAFRAKVANDPARYGKVRMTTFAADRHAIAPPGTADLVVTFRNLHNWMERGEADAALATFYKALKPGGVLGIVDHRGRTDAPQDPAAKSGYVRQDYAIALAEKAGFRFEAASEVKANPKDTKDYAVGVWALPPTWREGDKDRARYAAIGESDRFTLKFVKPVR
jgi:predicted methyltransferase